MGRPKNIRTNSTDQDPGSSQNPIIGPDLSTTVPLPDPDPDPVFFTKNLTNLQLIQLFRK